MRKGFLGVLAAVIVLSADGAAALAAGPVSGCCFTDINGDGICDNCGGYHWHSMTKNGCGGNFVDADGDGICDNCGSYHWHGTAGNGCGGSFVDADGNGICDGCDNYHWYGINNQNNGSQSRYGYYSQSRHGHHSHGRHCR